MNRDEQREARTILRRIDAHLRQSHIDMGAKEESAGFTDIIYHDNNILPTLNYVTPRRNTAWVSGNHIEQGLVLLNEKANVSRVRFAEGLYPPVFVKTLRDLGLQVESETSILIYRKQEQPRKMPHYPADVTFKVAESAEELGIWWYVWRNAYYDVAVSSIEPLLIARDLQYVFVGRQVNLIMYRQGYPMGVLRLSLHEGTAHLVAHALLKEMREPEWDKLIREVALDTALNQGTDLFFVSGKTEAERKLYRELGFVDSGSIVSYAEVKQTSKRQEGSDDTLAQSILVL